MNLSAPDKKLCALSFALCAALFALWMASSSAAALCRIPYGGKEAFNAFYAAGVGGVLLGGFLGDKMISYDTRRKFAAIMALLSGVLLILVVLAPSKMPLILLVCAQSVTGFSIISILFLDLLRKAGDAKQPLLIAVISLPFLVFLLLKNFAVQGNMQSAYWVAFVLGIIASFAIFFVLLFLPFINNAFAIKPNSDIPLDQPALPLLLRWGALMLLLGTCLYGFSVAALEGMMERLNLTGITLLLGIAGPFVVVLLCFIIGRRACIKVGAILPVLVLPLLIVPAALPLAPVVYILELLGSYLLMIPALTLFVSITKYTRYPGTVGALGLTSLGIFMLSKKFMEFLSVYINGMTAFIICLGLLVAVLFFAYKFFRRLEDYYIRYSRWEWDEQGKSFVDASLQEFVFTQVLELTEEDAQVLMLYLRGQSDDEIAENLYMPRWAVKRSIVGIQKLLLVGSHSELVQAANKAVEENAALFELGIEGAAEEEL